MRRSVLTLVLAGSVAVAACGSAKTATPAFVESTPATTQAVTTTAAPSTTTATTVAATTSILITTTTAAPATTVLALPAQPVDDDPGTPVAPDNGPGVGRIEIPRLGVDQRLQNNWDLATLDFGPGLMPGSPRPGQAGNMVVAGHRTSHSKPFRYIDTLQNGDEVVFTIKDRRYVYQVTGHLVVSPDAMWITDPTAEATATLFACHPPGSTSQRWVTRLKLISGG